MTFGGSAGKQGLRRPRGRLLRKYSTILAALVAGALIVSGAVQIWFSAAEHKEALVRIQREKATAAAAAIEQFVDGIEGQLGWTTHASVYAGPGGAEQRRFDFIRLLRQVDTIIELVYIDRDGKEQLRISSRVIGDAVGSGVDRSGEPAFRGAKEQGVWRGPVYFHKRYSRPLMAIAAEERSSGGVTVARVNLRFIWDVVSDIEVGRTGRAYVVDSVGRLIAHPDITLVLRQTDLAGLPQVAAALAGAPAGEPITAPDPEGREALSTHARIAPLGWLVFVDLPIAEAYAPLYASILRSGGLVLAGVLLAALAGLLLARRMTGPIHRLQEGAARIGGGDLADRIEISTGDELESLAAEFNHMAARLHESYTGLEQKVEERTGELASARQRLIDAIESISEGFAFYDADDWLQLCNTRYRELFAGSDIKIEPGMSFEAIVRRAVERGLIREAGDDPERYIQERLAQHRDPGPPTLHHLTDGRWILSAERKVAAGGTVAVYSDITELKQRETELEVANRRTQEAADEIGRKHRDLEVLSNKLAKYLSPQVYASIFEGRQEVKLASQRKKLTVFFSDIAGFTEITDQMESEDLTHLLNQYLTEMSRVALEHGATIDKYVGDAIMIFFGDPETRGVKEDALACVHMAIAMQQRKQELGAIWRGSGIETPFSCRIGIHTGYCTVGNFGSEDRMDYTIVGGAVNLASRLEHEAPPGGILISYETYAHVKDEVRCEELGRIQVRGIGHPVGTYRVLDLHAADGSERIRSELPHLKLDADPDLMSADERRQAAALLQEALDRLTPRLAVPASQAAHANPGPGPRPDARRRVRKAS